MKNNIKIDYVNGLPNMIHAECPWCHKTSTIELSLEDAKKFNDAYSKWLNGMRIQDAFPWMSPSDRELLMTGICDECWNNM